MQPFLGHMMRKGNMQGNRNDSRKMLPRKAAKKDDGGANKVAGCRTSDMRRDPDVWMA